METRQYMPKSSNTSESAQPETPEPLLNLPDGRDFHPVKWQVPIEVIVRLSEQRLAIINGRPGAQAERLARMTPVKFRL